MIMLIIAPLEVEIHGAQTHVIAVGAAVVVVNMRMYVHVLASFNMLLRRWQRLPPIVHAYVQTGIVWLAIAPVGFRVRKARL